MKLSRKNSALLGIAALPIATLMLAKMFDSAVLGWMFGVTLAFGMAVVPLAAILCVASRVLGWALDKRRASASIRAARGTCTLHVGRDSVHASDDAPSQLFTVPAACKMHELVAEVLANGYLPSISGGRATWVVESIDGPHSAARKIAVWAQEWSRPAFVLRPGDSVACHFADMEAGLHFRYLCQVNPDDVLASLLTVHAQKL